MFGENFFRRFFNIDQPPTLITPEGDEIHNAAVNMPEEMPEELKQILGELVERIGESHHVGIARVGGGMLNGGHHGHAPREISNDHVTPSPEQLDLKPGDTCITMDTLSINNLEVNAPIKHIITVLDPEEHAEEFPDWQERVWKNFVLGEYTTNYDYSYDQKDVGWFPRIKLIKLPEAWMKDAIFDFFKTVPEFNTPSWFVELAVNAIQGLINANDRQEVNLPDPLPCGSCGSIAVILEEVQTRKIWYLPGAIAGDIDPENPDTRDPDRNLYAYGEVHNDLSEVYRLLCLNCDEEAPLDTREYFLHYASTINR